MISEAAAQAPASSMPAVPSRRRTWAATSKSVVGDPARVGGPARAELDAVASARALRQPGVHGGAQPLEVERLGGGLEHQHLQRVAGDRRGLERQDVRVVGAQALAGGLHRQPDSAGAGVAFGPGSRSIRLAAIAPMAQSPAPARKASE